MNRSERDPERPAPNKNSSTIPALIKVCNAGMFTKLPRAALLMRLLTSGQWNNGH
jgi:hypothetical protein